MKGSEYPVANKMNSSDTILGIVGGTTKQIPQSVFLSNALQFPYDKLVPVWYDPTILVLRLMVDPVNGNDANDGYTWAAAKKTIQGAIDLLPSDMLSYGARILCAPGDLGPATVNKTNGSIWFNWVGSSYNTAGTDAGVWFRNGASSLNFTDNASILTSAPGKHAFQSKGRNLTITFETNDAVNNKWSVDKWIWRSTSNINLGEVAVIDNFSDVYCPQLRLELAGEFWYGIVVNAQAKFKIDTFTVIGNDGGGCSQRNGDWSGVINGSFDCTVIIGDSLSLGNFNTGQAPPKAIQVTNAKTIFTAIPNCNSSFITIDATSASFTAGTTGKTKPEILLGTAVKSAGIRYDSNVVSLIDKCTMPHSVYDSSTSTSNTVSGPLLTSQLKLSALNAAPASAAAAGTLGEIRIVNGYIYVCVATNTWQRAALATW